MYEYCIATLICCLQGLKLAPCLQHPQKLLGCLQVLTEELGSLVGALSFTRSMRWNGSTAFSRPVRWLLALHGSTVLPFSFAGLQAGGSDSCQQHADSHAPVQGTTFMLHLSHSANSANYVDAAVLVAQLFWQMSKVLWR